MICGAADHRTLNIKNSGKCRKPIRRPLLGLPPGSSYDNGIVSYLASKLPDLFGFQHERHGEPHSFDIATKCPYHVKISVHSMGILASGHLMGIEERASLPGLRKTYSQWSARCLRHQTASQ